MSRQLGYLLHHRFQRLLGISDVMREALCGTGEYSHMWGGVMPELDLSGKEVLDWQDSLKVLAVMLYPKDQGAREEYMIRFKADKYLCLGLPDEQIMLPLTKLLAPLGGFRALSEGP